MSAVIGEGMKVRDALVARILADSQFDSFSVKKYSCYPISEDNYPLIIVEIDKNNVMPSMGSGSLFLDATLRITVLELEEREGYFVDGILDPDYALGLVESTSRKLIDAFALNVVEDIIDLYPTIEDDIRSFGTSFKINYA